VWYAEKLSLVKYVRFLELWAERESNWEQRNPGRIETVNSDTSIQSASKALRIARRETPYLDWMETDEEPQVRTAPKKVRKVQFAEDVVERPKRSNEAFRRASAEYRPGMWSAGEGGEWFDTSFVLEPRYGDWTFDEDLDDEWQIHVNIASSEREEVRKETLKKKTEEWEWEVRMEEWEEERARQQEIRELGEDLGMICLV
jgi:hypothetical protein